MKKLFSGIILFALLIAGGESLWADEALSLIHI